MTRSLSEAEIIDALARCPRCGGRADGFNHVSTPVGAEDGFYGLCPRCGGYWRLALEWNALDGVDFDHARTLTEAVRARLAFFGHLEHAELTAAQIKRAKAHVRRRQNSDRGV
jgi:hypothetical protein